MPLLPSTAFAISESLSGLLYNSNWITDFTSHRLSLARSMIQFFRKEKCREYRCAVARQSNLLIENAAIDCEADITGLRFVLAHKSSNSPVIVEFVAKSSSAKPFVQPAKKGVLRQRWCHLKDEPLSKRVSKGSWFKRHLRNQNIYHRSCRRPPPFEDDEVVFFGYSFRYFYKGVMCSNLSSYAKDHYDTIDENVQQSHPHVSLTFKIDEEDVTENYAKYATSCFGPVAQAPWRKFMKLVGDYKITHQQKTVLSSKLSNTDNTQYYSANSLEEYPKRFDDKTSNSANTRQHPQVAVNDKLEENLAQSRFLATSTPQKKLAVCDSVKRNSTASEHNKKLFAANQYVINASQHHGNNNDSTSQQNNMNINNRTQNSTRDTDSWITQNNRGARNSKALSEQSDIEQQIMTSLKPLHRKRHISETETETETETEAGDRSDRLVRRQHSLDSIQEPHHADVKKIKVDFNWDNAARLRQIDHNFLFYSEIAQ